MALPEQDVLRILMRSRTRVSAAAWLLVHDMQASEDIFQNVALKAITKEVDFQVEAEVLSWAFITARREAIDWLRKRDNRKMMLSEEVAELICQDWADEPPSHRDERVEALRGCLESMPERSQDLLKLRYFEGRSCDDVAERLGVGVDAIYKRLSRLHHRLRDCVETRLDSLVPAKS